MRYAVISDIHGNYPALKAVLADARTQGVDAYLFLGDYFRDFPWPNEVAELIRVLPSTLAIRGNNEGYLIDMGMQDQDQWIYEQLGMLYWNYRALREENLEYLTKLPETAVIPCEGGDIHLAHPSNVFYRTPIMKLFHPSGFREMMEREPFTHAEYLVLAKEAILSRPDALHDIRAMPKGVYLFGHHHIQFHVEYEGRLFINPGSCGASTDCNTSAPYVILGRVDSQFTVTERRVEYDLNATAEGLRTSDLAAYTPVWAATIERQLMTGKDFFGSLVRHVAATGRKFGQTRLPVDNDIWKIAAETWEV